MTVRGLARDIGVSPSLISQIETDKSQPSVSTLYAITTALDIAIEDLFDEPDTAGRRVDGDAASSPDVAPLREAAVPPDVVMDGVSRLAAQMHSGQPSRLPQGATRDRPRRRQPVVQPDERELLTLDSGVTWERLGQVPNAHVDFLLITYRPGSTSSSSGELMRHSGTEYGYLLKGSLILTLAFDEYRLHPGDAVSFDSTTPHGYRNDGFEPAVGVWFVLERV